MNHKEYEKRKKAWDRLGEAMRVKVERELRPGKWRVLKVYTE